MEPPAKVAKTKPGSKGGKAAAVDAAEMAAVNVIIQFQSSTGENTGMVAGRCSQQQGFSGVPCADPGRSLLPQQHTAPCTSRPAKAQHMFISQLRLAAVGHAAATLQLVTAAMGTRIGSPATALRRARQ